MLLKALGCGLGGLRIGGAVAVSTPIDLKSAQLTISRPRNRVYHDYIVRLMRDGFLAGPGVAPEERRLVAEKVETVRDFDDYIVAPRFGFSSAEDYYEAASGRHALGDIDRPTLLIQADDDPWIPKAAFEAVAWERFAPMVRLVMTRGGGHVGFHGRSAAAAWHDRAALRFFENPV